ncbi:hypothetical protein AB6A40_003828 [Gnathostoma spinigerum]|uniref:Uncharacterized protein n=1 Tax=Gnathostoma spinigerum TaxID=75299 RepID=A0ABD6EIF2_9BILA
MLILGVRNRKTRQVLLRESDLTLEEAANLETAIERLEIEMKHVAESEQQNSVMVAVHNEQKGHPKGTRSQSSKDISGRLGMCAYCGSNRHSKDQRKYKTNKFNCCG